MLNGYYFVLIEYASGRFGYSEHRYKTERQAERRATILRMKSGVRTAKVRYQAGQTAVDIKKFI